MLVLQRAQLRVEMVDEDALELARAAGRACGLDVSGARQLRARASIMIALPAAGTLARVEPANRRFIARRMAALGRAFAACGCPTTRLVAPERQPLEFEHGAVTLWHWLEGPSASVDDYEAIGALTRTLHERTRRVVGSAELPVLEPFAEVRVWLAELAADDYDRRRRAKLQDRTSELVARWRRLDHETGLGRALVHGDVHHENVIMSAEGPVFVDLELGGAGPAVWDFATLANGVRRYGVPELVFDAFARGYGHNPRGRALLESCREVYEFCCVVWAARCRRQSPELAAEAEVRFATVFGELDGPGPSWRLL